MLETCIRIWVIGALCAWTPLAIAQSAPGAAPATAKPGPLAEAQRDFKEGKFAKAAGEFAAFSKANPSDPQSASAWVQEGLCHLKMGHAVEAVHCWDWVLQRYPTSPQVPEAMEQLALSYDAKANHAGADALREKLLAQFPDHPIAVRIWIARGDAFFKQGRPAEAVKAYEKAGAKLTPDAKQKLETARKLVLGSAGPDSLLAAAGESLTASDTVGAITLYVAWLQKYSNTARAGEAKTKLGWCYSLQNTPESLKKAEDLWQSVIQKGPANDPWVGESQWNLIQLLAGPKAKWEDATKLCEVVARNFPKSARGEQALFTKAWLYWAHQRWTLSRPAFDEYLRAYPEAIEHPPIKAYLRDCEEGLNALKKP